MILGLLDSQVAQLVSQIVTCYNIDILAISQPLSPFKLDFGDVKCKDGLFN